MSPKVRMVMGLLFIPAFLLQNSVLIRSIQLGIIILLYILQGGKFHILPNVILISGIITAFLIRPAGVVLFSIWGFPVTEGALLSGISRAVILIGLIYISRLSVSSRLRLNSTAGNLLGRVFFYFEAITESNHTFPYKDIYRKGGGAELISYFDDLLLSVEQRGNSTEKMERDVSDSASFRILPALLFITVSYTFLFI